jgi:hypothetical protein
MKPATQRALLGFVTAPLVPCTFMWAFEFGADPRAWSAVAFGATVAYVATLLICVPAYILITTYSRLRPVNALAVSGVAGTTAMAFISEGRSLEAAGVGFLLGLSAGLTFWLVWRNAAQQAVAADAASPRR